MENKFFVIEYKVNFYYGEVGDVFMTIKFFGDYSECENYINNNTDNKDLHIVKMNETLEINY